MHVAGDNFWAYAVADGRTTLSDVATHPDDEAVMELLAVHSAFYGPPEDTGEFSAEMIANRRLVVRLQVDRIYGLVASGAGAGRCHQPPLTRIDGPPGRIRCSPRGQFARLTPSAPWLMSL